MKNYEGESTNHPSTVRYIILHLPEFSLIVPLSFLHRATLSTEFDADLDFVAGLITYFRPTSGLPAPHIVSSACSEKRYVK